MKKKSSLYQKLDPRSKCLRKAGMTFFYFVSLVYGLWSMVYGLPQPTAWAGGPIFVNPDGEAATWDNSEAITYHPESGACATHDNSEMVDRIENNLSLWTGITSIELTLTPDEGEIGSIDVDNYATYFAASESDSAASDGINPVIFDDDGEIVGDLFGSGNKVAVLGFAGPDGYSSDYATITDGEAFFNCFCILDNPNDTDGDCEDFGIEFTEDDLDFTMIHEMGHMLGLDHTQVNQPIGEGSCDLDTEGDCDDLPTMFPVSVDAGDQMTPQRDDEVAFLNLYGSSTWDDSLCTITGSLLDANGDPLRCADVQAETGDTADTVALVSGIYAPNEDTNGDGLTDGEGECLSDCGDFTLRGLDPDKSYTITVKPIDSAWEGGSGIYPCDPQLEGIEEEPIATIDACDAGETIELGSVETASTGSGSGSDDDDTDSDPDAFVACGVNLDFDDCAPIFSCAMNPQGTSYKPWWIFIPGYWCVIASLRRSRSPNGAPFGGDLPG